MSTPTLLDLQGLTVEYRRNRRKPPFRAVDDVSLTIAEGETVGLVGESGSGKSTIGRAVLGLTPVRSGTVRFEGADITHAGAGTRRELSARLQVVFQDPYSSLNPARTIGQTLAEPLPAHRGAGHGPASDQVASMLERVGLPAEAAGRYPGRFSGGQRQRIAIARALMLSPRLVICDEPVSALDLSIQAQVINLLAELQAEMALSYLFIAHDLPVVRHLAHRIVVLYRGRVMETGRAEELYAAPVHPYTRMLIAAVPEPDPRVQRARRDHRDRKDRREEPDPQQSAPRVQDSDTRVQGSDTAGCVFAPRCPLAIDLCHREQPTLMPIPGAATARVPRQAACHRAAELHTPSPS